MTVAAEYAYVQDVYTDTVTGEPRLNLTTAAGAPLPGVPVALVDYYAQRDDKVIVDWVGGQPVVIGCRTPNRGRPVDPRTITIGNAAPGAGWDQIVTTYAQSGVDTNPNLFMARSVAAPPSTAGSLQVVPLAARSWRPDGWLTTAGQRAYQGDYGYGNHKGVWLYPSITAALSGKTLTGMSIRLARSPQSIGSDGGVQHGFWLHAYAAQPAGEPTLIQGPYSPPEGVLGRGAIAEVPLPVSWATQFQGGTALGVAIHMPDGSAYSAIIGPEEELAPGVPSQAGRLTFTYS